VIFFLLPSTAFFLCTDDNYAPHAGTCIFSLLLSTEHRDFDIHIIGAGISDGNKSKFLRLSRLFGISIFIHDATKYLALFVKLNPSYALHGSSHFSDATLLRLMYPEIIDCTCSKIAYVDCDVIFAGDAYKLLEIELGHFLLGASHDLMASFLPENSEKCQPEYPYFNSGVLLIDDFKWRSEGISMRLLDAFESSDPERLIYADQDVLNTYFEDLGYLQLPLSLNYQYMFTGDAFFMPSGHMPLDQAIIIHYAGKYKPWHDYVPSEYSQLYEKFRMLSPWAADYKTQLPTSIDELLIGYKILLNQKRYSEATNYATKILQLLLGG